MVSCHATLSSGDSFCTFYKSDVSIIMSCATIITQSIIIIIILLLLYNHTYYTSHSLIIHRGYFCVHMSSPTGLAGSEGLTGCGWGAGPAGHREAEPTHTHTHAYTHAHKAYTEHSSPAGLAGSEGLTGCGWGAGPAGHREAELTHIQSCIHHYNIDITRVNLPDRRDSSLKES